MLSGLDQLVADGLADPDRLGIMGMSYGGFMACWLPTQDARFRAAVAISPVSDWYSERFGSNLGAWVGDFLDGEPRPAGGQYYDRSPVLFAARRPHAHAAHLGRARPRDAARPGDRVPQRARRARRRERRGHLSRRGPRRGLVPGADRLHDARRGVVPAPHADSLNELVSPYERMFAMLARWHPPNARSAGRWPAPSRSARCSNDDVDPLRELREVEYLHVRARTIISEVPQRLAHAVPLHDQRLPRL